ncbi:universal stress protein [Flagellimonas sp.]|uniref:universal stress protein n=1 Tax=Flagellimonas sp. TaxID=2058762 RepID=UPI003B503EFE
MKNVLVTMDFSEHSINALSYGQMLFKESEVTFYLFAAFQLNAPGVIEDEWGNDWLESEENGDWDSYFPLEDLEKILKKVKRKNRNERHKFKITYSVNTLEEGIKEQLTKLDIDLILMGTKGVKGLEQFFLGNKAVTIIHKTQNCPIIVVPGTYIKTNGLKQVVFSTNFKRPFNLIEVYPLLELLQQWGAVLKIVQLMDEAYLDDKQKLHKNALVSLLGGIPHFFHKIVFDSSETAAIRDFVKESQSDIISLIYHRQNFLYGLLQENVVKRTAFSSEVPILVLKGI